VRAQRKEALRAVRRGKIALTEEQKALVREAVPELRFFTREHPKLAALRRWVEEQRLALAPPPPAPAGEAAEAEAAAAGGRLACLSLALPLGPARR